MSDCLGDDDKDLEDNFVGGGGGGGRAGGRGGAGGGGGEGSMS